MIKNITRIFPYLLISILLPTSLYPWQLQAAQAVQAKVSEDPMDYLPDYEFKIQGVRPETPSSNGNVSRLFTLYVYDQKLNPNAITAENYTNVKAVPLSGKRLTEAQNEDLLSFSLWDLYVAAAEKGIKPMDLGYFFVLQTEYVFSASSDNYTTTEIVQSPLVSLEATPIGAADAVTLEATAKKYDYPTDKRGGFKKITMTANFMGAKNNFFQKMPGWSRMLPPSWMLRSDFLYAYAQQKRIGKTPLVADVLDILYAYFTRPNQAAWPMGEPGDTTQTAQDIVALPTASGDEYWKVLAGNLMIVTKKMKQDIVAYPDELQSIAYAGRPQIFVRNDNKIINTIEVENPSASSGAEARSLNNSSGGEGSTGGATADNGRPPLISFPGRRSGPNFSGFLVIGALLAGSFAN